MDKRNLSLGVFTNPDQFNGSDWLVFLLGETVVVAVQYRRHGRDFLGE